MYPGGVPFWLCAGAGTEVRRRGVELSDFQGGAALDPSFGAEVAAADGGLSAFCTGYYPVGQWRRLCNRSQLLTAEAEGV